MNTKYYKKEDLSNKKYAILITDAEEPYSFIVSLHGDYNKAKKRFDYLKKKAQIKFEKGVNICNYILIDTNNNKIKNCLNYED